MTDRQHEMLELFREVDETGLSAPQVAATLGISKPAAWRRLSDLSEAGLLARNVEEDSFDESWVLTEDGMAALED